jgi:hypothetical protein
MFLLILYYNEKVALMFEGVSESLKDVTFT